MKRNNILLIFAECNIYPIAHNIRNSYGRFYRSPLNLKAAYTTANGASLEAYWVYPVCLYLDEVISIARFFLKGLTI